MLFFAVCEERIFDFDPLAVVKPFPTCTTSPLLTVMLNVVAVTHHAITFDNLITNLANDLKGIGSN